MHQVVSHALSSGLVALMGIGLPAAETPPEWIHILPSAQGRIETNDSRGPYFVRDAAALIAASLAEGDELPIDENHATDLAAPRGEAAPARGWITAMETRADGIWAKVRWTNAGRELIADRAYRGISPVILHDQDKTIRRVLRASLVNKPNLRGLTALHQEGNVTFQARVAEKLGLNAAATEDDILAALPKPDAAAVALQAALPEIATALGIDKGSDVKAVVAAAKTAGQDTKTVMPALQAQVTQLSAQLEAIQAGAKREKAEAFFDSSLREGRQGLNQQNRADFVAMHMENPERTEKLINGFAKLSTPAPAGAPPAALQASADDLVGKARAYQASQKAAGNDISWTDAVVAVSEGKK